MTYIDFPWEFLLVITSMIILFYDIKYLHIPYVSILFLFVFGVVKGYISFGVENICYRILFSSATGIFIWSIAIYYKKVLKIDAMGDADPFLIISLSLWLKSQYIPLAILLSCIVTFIFLFIKKNINAKIPFAPGLCIGFITIYFVTLKDSNFFSELFG